MEEKPNKVNTFWAAYYDAVLGSGLPEKSAQWYVNCESSALHTGQNLL